MLNGRTTCSVKRIVQYYIVYISRLSDIYLPWWQTQSVYYVLSCRVFLSIEGLSVTQEIYKNRVEQFDAFFTLQIKLDSAGLEKYKEQDWVIFWPACKPLGLLQFWLVRLSTIFGPILTIWPVIIACCTIRFFCFLFLWRVLTLWTIFLTKLESRPPGNWCWDVSSS